MSRFLSKEKEIKKISFPCIQQSCIADTIKPMKTIEQILAERIKHYRAVRGFRTQYDLSAACEKLSKGAIARIETCTLWPSPTTLKQIADALEVPVSALLSEEHVEVKASPRDAIKIIQHALDKTEKRAKSSEKSLHFLNKDIEKLALRLAAIDNPKIASYISQLVNGALDHLVPGGVVTGGQVKKNSG